MSMTRDAVRNPPPPGEIATGPRGIMLSGALSMASKVIGLLERIASSLEPQDEIDTTFTFTGGVNAGGVASGWVQTIQLPRTVRYAEIELMVDAGTPFTMAALFSGQTSLGDAAKALPFTVGGSSSNAIVVGGSGKWKIRDRIDQSGYLTLVVFTTNAGGDTMVANVRVRQLDGAQSYAQR